MSKQKIVIVIIFLAASVLRLADAFRPINQASWRESDLGGIARNFAQEDMNPMHPRIDWRGAGPGYVEMEVPLYPWLIAASYKVFGVHDWFGRMWAFLFSLGTLFFFFRLARAYLDEFASIIAFAFFALNPLIIEVSTAVQPEGLMIFSYVAAVDFFLRWLRTEKDVDLCPAVFMTALTILAKAPAAHIGLFFGILLIDKYGWHIVKMGRVWIFGVFTLAPAAAWYLHAKNLWMTYGNSLGVSNEYHWIGWDFFTNADFATGILRSELAYVWIGFGLIAGAFAIWQGYKDEPAKHSLLWLACVFVLYLLAARTTSEAWANYYHVFSIPPAALIFGLSIEKLWDYTRVFTDSFSRRTLFANLGRVAVIFVVTGAILATLALEAKAVRANFLGHLTDDPAFACAARIKPAMKTEGLIVVSGGHCLDKNGYVLAYNASFMFYWLDRKGWNVCVEDQSAARIRDLSSQGAKYFVAQKSYLSEVSGFENDLRRSYQVAAECDEFILFDLSRVYLTSSNAEKH